MARTKIDWVHHVTEFRASAQTAAEYCASSGLKLGSFQYHLYKSKGKVEQSKRFKEFHVTTELIISRDHCGALTLSGFDLAQLPQIVGAWSNALSQ